MDITTRIEAHKLHKTYYFTGKRCKRGHLAQRYVSNGGCKACLNGIFKKFRSGVTHDLDSFLPSKLVAPVVASREDLISLRHYLQTCIFAYALKNWPAAITPGVQLAINMHARSTPELNNPDEIP